MPYHIWTTHPVRHPSIAETLHYDGVTMSATASRITSLTIVYSTVYSGADQRKHQGSASLAFVRGIQRGPVNSPHKWPVTWKCFHLMTSSWHNNHQVKSPTSHLFANISSQANNKEISKLHVTGPVWGKSTYGQLILLTKSLAMQNDFPSQDVIMLRCNLTMNV